MRILLHFGAAAITVWLSQSQTLYLGQVNPAGWPVRQGSAAVEIKYGSGATCESAAVYPYVAVLGGSFPTSSNVVCGQTVPRLIVNFGNGVTTVKAVRMRWSESPEVWTDWACVCSGTNPNFYALLNPPAGPPSECDVRWIPSLSRGYAYGGLTAPPSMRIKQGGTVKASITAGGPGTVFGVGGTTFTGVSETVTTTGGGEFSVEVLDGNGTVKKTWSVTASCTPGKSTFIRVHGSSEEGLLANKYDVRGETSEADYGQPPPANTESGPSHTANQTVTNNGFTEQKYRWQAQAEGYASDVWQEFTLQPGESNELTVHADRPVTVRVEESQAQSGGGSSWVPIHISNSIQDQTGLPSDFVTVYQGDWGTSTGDFWTNTEDRTTDPPNSELPAGPKVGAGADTTTAVNNLNADNEARGAEARADEAKTRAENARNTEILTKVLVAVSGKESALLREIADNTKATSDGVAGLGTALTGLLGPGTGGGELGAQGYSVLGLGQGDGTEARNALYGKMGVPTVAAGVDPQLRLPFSEIEGVGMADGVYDFSSGFLGTLRVLVRSIALVAVAIMAVGAGLAIIRDVT